MTAGSTDAGSLQPGNGYRLPPDAYRAQDWFLREQRQLFRRTWNFVGETRDLPAPGDFLTSDVGGGPVLVVRGEDGELRAFHNVCRHRGAKLLDDRGQCSAIVCPYHRWRYGLDGALDNVPQQATQFPGLERDDWGLLPVALAEWRGLLFVNPDGLAPAFDRWLADLPEHIGGFVPADLEVLVEGTFEFTANWKFYIENHVDWYHLWYTHPQSLRMWDHHAGRMFRAGVHWGSFEPAREGPDAMTPPLAPIDGLSPRERQNGAHLVFPNLTLFTGDGYFAHGLVTPLGPDRARMHFRALIAPGQAPTPELAQEVLQAFREITEVEDAGMTERLQAAVHSDAFRVGPMTLEHEAPITHFHDAYLEVFGAVGEQA
ncbi:MAG TPA: aromatic ring-hydroxylating dioxygenase subunit alpha [Pseudomonadales bacterium]|nr:aromatic ring-hydroxylating dioxygenase subunit alpha [Pseudomonadales bacterium]